MAAIYTTTVYNIMSMCLFGEVALDEMYSICVPTTSTICKQ